MLGWKPLAPSRNETNSSRVSGGADGVILGICAYGRPDQAGIHRFPRWPVSDGLQGGNAPAALLESHGGILPKWLRGRNLSLPVRDTLPVRWIQLTPLEDRLQTRRLNPAGFSCDEWTEGLSVKPACVILLTVERGNGV